MRIGIFIALIFLASLPLCAQDYIQGFEQELKDWRQIIKEGYPHYNSVKLRTDPANAYEGKSYLVMKTLGGSVAYQTRKGLIKIDPEYGYRLSVWVKLVKTKRDAVYLTITWLDKEGQAFAEERSMQITHAPDWSELFLEVENVPRKAVGALICLTLEGPDFRGEAWLDNLSLRRRIKVHIDAPENPGNLFLEGQSVKLRFRLEAGEPGPYILEFQIHDFYGTSLPPPPPLKLAKELQGIQRFRIDQIGYYEIGTTIKKGERVLARKVVPIVILSRSRLFEDVLERDLGVIMNPYTIDISNIPLLLSALQCGHARIILWQHQPIKRKREPTQKELETLMVALWGKRVNPIGIFLTPPFKLFGHVDETILKEGIWEVFKLPQEKWETQLKDTINLYREYINQWQIGREPYLDPALGEIIKNVDQVAKSTSRFSCIGIPLDWGHLAESMPPASFYEILSDPGLKPEGLLSAPSAIRERQRHITLHTKPLEYKQRYLSILRQAIDLIKKFTYAKIKGIGQISFPLVTGTFQGPLNEGALPNPIFPVMRVISDILSQTRYERLHIFDPPIQSHLFIKPNQEAVMVVWSDQAELEIEVFLGDDVRVVDILGRTRPLLNNRLKITPVPQFLLDVNPHLIRTYFTLDFADGAEVISKSGTITKIITLVNHFPEEISDISIEFTGIPRHWSVRPTRIEVQNLAPKAALHEYVNISMPITQMAGESPLKMQIQLKVQKRLHKVTLERRLKIVSPIECKFELKPTADPKVRQVVITLASKIDRRITLKIFVMIPDLPMFEINRVLHPGGAEQLRFTLKDAEKYAGEKIYLRALETHGDIFTNREWIIPAGRKD